jgi:enediyne biosynthesis protein E4
MHKQFLVYTLLVGVLIFSLFFNSCSSVQNEFPDFEWQAEEGYRWAALPQLETNRVGFDRIYSSHSGVEFSNYISDELIVQNRNLLNGSGVAIGDVTGNGWPDIYFSRIEGPNALYENLGGYRFREITEQAGVALPDQYSTGALLADLNGNGYLDLVVSSIGSPNRLFFNNGEGVFDEVENGLPSDRTYGSSTIAAGDLTGNGAPDLYISNYKVRSVRDIYPNENEFRHIVQQTGEDEFELRPKFEEHYRFQWRDQFLIWFETGEPDLLYLNDGNGNFERVDLTSGILFDEDGEPITEPLKDWGLHAKIYDINQNGLQDIYVANDFESPDRIWLNQGDGTFRALPRLAKRKSSLSSMAVDFSDINRNGLTDFFVIEMLSRSHTLRHRQMSTMAPSPQDPGAIENRPQYLGNTLFLNRGDQTWAEISEYSGVRRSDWSWSASFLDVTLDGYEDILITTGHYLDVQDSDANMAIRAAINTGRMDMERSMLYYTYLPNQNAAFRNEGDLTFTDVSSDWGFTDLDISHGLAIADLNKSGYPDLVINRLGDEALIYSNRADRPRILVRLKGESPNTQGGGAVIKVDGGPVSQSKTARISGGYLSSSDQDWIFAATPEAYHTITVLWPDGKMSTIENAKANRIYELSQSDAVMPDRENENRGVASSSPLFREISSDQPYRHQYPEFDDLERQPLLHKRLDRTGPSFSMIDLDGSGRDDLVISGSSGANSGFYSYSENEELVRLDIEWPGEIAGWDQSSTAGWRDHDGVVHLIVGFSGYTPADREAPAAAYVTIHGDEMELQQIFERFGSSVGIISLADYSGNGYPDLFLAGQVKPGRYPEPAASKLYLNNGTEFVPDTDNNQLFENIGLISGSVFSDLTDNGKPELILAEKWGMVRVFEIRDRRFYEITSGLGFDAYRGWWNGVATGDFTGNGKLDIAATNWGRNHPYMFRNDGENIIYYSDINRDGHIDIIEAYYDEEVGDIVPRRGLQYLVQFPPFVGRNVNSYEEYAQSSLEQILGHSPERYQKVEAGFYDHVIFLQSDDGTFEKRSLPQKAQLAPAFEPLVADFDGDGNLDLFFSQNYFSYWDELPRSDAGRGLLLLGDGTGSFEPVPGHQSGILVYGEQRGAAAGDLNGNGRMDLVTGQFANEAKVYQNESAGRLFSVRLTGPTENPAAIGAQVRLRFQDGTYSSVREIQAGSGYRGQNSFTQLFGNDQGAESAEVRWPDGTRSEKRIEDGAIEMTIRYDEN